MFGQAPDWVVDVGVWTGAVASVVTLTGIVWAIVRRARKALAAELADFIAAQISQQTKELTARVHEVGTHVEHLHDCMEAVKDKADQAEKKIAARDAKLDSISDTVDAIKSRVDLRTG